MPVSWGQSSDVFGCCADCSNLVMKCRGEIVVAVPITFVRTVGLEEGHMRRRRVASYIYCCCHTAEIALLLQNPNVYMARSESSQECLVHGLHVVVNGKILYCGYAKHLLQKGLGRVMC